MTSPTATLIAAAATTAALISAAAATLISAAAATLISATALISAATVFSGITAVIVLFASAVVEANALLADGDALLGGICVSGITDHEDRSGKQQRRQFEDVRFVHLAIHPIETAFDAALERKSIFGADLLIAPAGCSRRTGLDRDDGIRRKGRLRHFNLELNSEAKIVVEPHLPRRPLFKGLSSSRLGLKRNFAWTTGKCLLTWQPKRFAWHGNHSSVLHAPQVDLRRIGLAEQPMGVASDEYASLHFSTSEIVERDRLPFWRDFFCREIVQVDIEPESDLPLSAEVSLISCPGLQGMWASTSIPVRLSRTAEMLDDGIDNIALVINLDGRASVTQGHEATLNGFDAIGVLHAEPVAMCRSSGKWMALMIPRQALSPAIADIKRATMQLIPSGNAAIGLLVSYMDSLKDRLPSMSPELGKLAVSHIQDLIAMAFGATGNGSESVALSGGVRAARLHAIKADVLSNLGSHDLTLTNVAKRHRVTPRYIHMIFELEGISFSEYVLEQRLLRALHLMTDRRFADWKVTALASEAGFGDLSYFNRTFRRRFAMTPSEARKLHAERVWMHSADELTGKGESS